MPAATGVQGDDDPTPLGGIEVASNVVAENLEQAIVSVLGLPHRSSSPPSLFDESLERPRPLTPVVTSSAQTAFPPNETAPSEVPTKATMPPVAHSLPPQSVVRQAPRTRAAWLAATMIPLLAAAVYVQQQHLFAARGEPQPAASADHSQAGAASLSAITAAVRALEEGDPELAEGLLSQTMPREKDPARALVLARALVAQADARWLEVRSQAAGRDAPIQELGRLSLLARRATLLALELAPRDPEALQLRVDSLRIDGELDAARELASRLTQVNAASGEYTFAALELAEPNANAAPVVSRLQGVRGKLPAASQAQAQALLVYALLRAQKLDAAELELERLKLRVRPHVAQQALDRWLSDLRKVSQKVTRGVSSAASPTPEQLLSNAQKHLQNGRLREAEFLYSLLVRQGNERLEALVGLAEVARQRGTVERAVELYDRVLRKNSSFLPARLGRADVDWQRGARDSARQQYRELLEGTDAALLPARVRERAR